MEPAELERRLASADCERRQLRRATLELREMGRRILSRRRTSVRLDISDPIAVLLAAADALGRAGVRVAAYGGLALAVYGSPRETKDAE